ncbi:substrate-binding domain-containing protein [Ensifer adhaerens]|uniref:LacI family DNA-binding transcriptional regulator n=1 Tax=Ensifer adhaerens TaxID=106592 RepID=UPI001CBBDB38|nr:substrate-binding domain-containing protein [Ensifer adhaerens]MBZ7924445.1 substrate-binding domain-containing protein [Ensifer adhaerens]UAX96311.1 substrate-binding domain-containing protein [Ensifer adhaerens]UAY04346.1 substrate-binding domain-containing protein [Ensifer adhaerens]UAY12331.1 substrate-binding domain-containing protein [Ensifer adhaerens]
MATLQQIAFHAGCSLATVSRVLNGEGPVSDEMVRRVRRAAAELGYRPTAATGRTAGRSQPVVGVLVPSVTNPVFAASLGGIQHRMQAANHGVLIAQSNYDPALEARAVRSLLEQRPTGLILTLCDARTSEALSAALPPTVLLNNRPVARFAAAVTVDNHRAGYELTRHILAHGHQRIVVVTGHFHSSDRARLRYDGYTAAMQEAGVQPIEAIEIPFVDGYENLDLCAVVAHHQPTAIIASNDLLALGVIAALRRQGLSVPDDVSVAGFDGIALGRLMSPTLTTISMPDGDMGLAAAALLLDMAENASGCRHLTLESRLYPGGTVRRLG